MGGMHEPGPTTVICTYRVRAGAEDRFRALLEDHWPLLRRLELATDLPARRFRGLDRDRKPVFFEVFEWKEAASASRAHEHPEVASVWDAMGVLVEERDGRPKWEFVHVEPLPEQG